MAVLASAAPVLGASDSGYRTPAAGQRRVDGAPLLRAPGERAQAAAVLRPAQLRSAAAGWRLRATAPSGGGRAASALWRVGGGRARYGGG
jgi:hypothetical protein